MQIRSAHWGPPDLTCSEASLSNLAKFFLNMPATFSRVSSNSTLLVQLSAGFRILELTPLMALGYFRLKMGRVSYSALASSPLWIALMISLVLLIEIL